MKAATAHAPDDVDMLQIREVGKPVPAEDEVRIRVRAFGNIVIEH